ncbi:hypothetical protein LAZ67_X000982 [Cordylochernes scorpioides]|uniref:Reverse transcriptase RNase H-like domain-containing protein n=1 Tax=Cordylochernes scorpioides TaxID=51811 RepID=A0ABY6LSJ1_9ARAC|nr:hypothetical protein LAZ67_X000982 [Cordylochernes scorpioides]
MSMHIHLRLCLLMEINWKILDVGQSQAKVVRFLNVKIVYIKPLKSRNTGHQTRQNETILDKLANAKKFSSADVTTVYWQIPIAEEPKPILTFVTPDGQYQFKRQPFGQKSTPQWDGDCHQAFLNLKWSLIPRPILYCHLHCDKSVEGISGVLKQVHPYGQAYPVQCFSRDLRKYERKYSISELECLAILESVDKFRVYLMGKRFAVYSDHQALRWLKSIKNPSGRLFCWILRLSAYLTTGSAILKVLNNTKRTSIHFTPSVGSLAPLPY